MDVGELLRSTSRGEIIKLEKVNVLKLLGFCGKNAEKLKS